VRRFAALFIGAVTCLGAAHVALADGAYWPARAFPKMPEIPAQRAIVAYRDGIETLIVESAVTSESERVAWILPLPAEPTDIAPVDPGILTTASFCTRPHIVHGGRSVYLLVVVYLLAPFVLAVCLHPLAKKSRLALVLGTHAVVILVIASLYLFGFAGERDPVEVVLYGLLAVAAIAAGRILISIPTIPVRRKRATALGSALFVLLFVPTCSLFLPSLGSAGASGALPVVPGVSVLQAHRVGGYDVRVLRADTAHVLSDWLARGGFRRPDAAAQVILDHYISEQWCFAVASLAVVADGPSAPHPLRVSFPSPTPIYPMRLTRLPGSDVDLELYVIADDSAGHPFLNVEFADRYAARFDATWQETQFKGTVSRRVGLRDLCDLMWDGCVLTRLSATVRPEQMTDDLRLQLTEGRLRRRTLYSARGARETAVFYGLFGLLVTAFVMALRTVFRDSPRRAVTLTLAGVLVAISCLGALATYVLLPRVEVGPTYRGGKGGRGPLLAMYQMRSTAQILAAQGTIDLDMTDEEIAAAFIDALGDEEYGYAEPGENPYLGGPVRREKSPGNFWIERLDGKTYLIVYDQDGRPWRVEVFPATIQPDDGGRRSTTPGAASRPAPNPG